MRLRLSLVLSLIVLAVPVFGADYILNSSQWGQAQADAVSAAGGTVNYAHPSGLAVVSSDNPDFAAIASIGGVFQSVTPDQMVQWQKPTPDLGIEELAVTPGNETFINAQWNHTAVNAQGAWSAGYTGAGVRVAILDGGIHAAHIDLAPNMDVARSKSFVPGFNFNQDVGTLWHGTHVAGIVAAADNGIGTIGIAPGAKLIGVKVLHNGSGSFGWLIPALMYASDPIADGGAGADIINMSLGATFPRGGGPGTGQLLGALAKAVNYAASKGVLVVTAAGNDGLDLGQSKSYISVPAESGSGIAVSSTGPLGFALGATNFRRPASYSNYGEGTITVAGPGGDFMLPGNALCGIPRVPSGLVVNPCWAFDMVISTVRGSGASISSYNWTAGTSMAAPAVSAVAALAKQAHPTLSLGGLKSKLKNSADDEGKKGNDDFYGHGFVNAGKAVQ
jgi:lantibiotic leader peptide-processing serine protease